MGKHQETSNMENATSDRRKTRYVNSKFKPQNAK
jgi:hypothetical protein